jgi:hypothetical protein
VQHLSAVYQRILRLERIGEPVELLEPRIGVVFAVLGVTGNLDGDDVLGDVLTPVGAEGGTEDPGAEEGAPLLLLAPARQPRSANSRSYSAACSARMWMTMMSSSLMTAPPSVALAPILVASPVGGQSVPDSTPPSARTHEIRRPGRQPGSPE